MKRFKFKFKHSLEYTYSYQISFNLNVFCFIGIYRTFSVIVLVYKLTRSLVYTSTLSKLLEISYLTFPMTDH